MRSIYKTYGILARKDHRELERIKPGKFEEIPKVIEISHNLQSVSAKIWVERVERLSSPITRTVVNYDFNSPLRWSII